jgi:hypothetical protein
VFWSQRRLCPCQPALVPGHTLLGRRGRAPDGGVAGRSKAASERALR